MFKNIKFRFVPFVAVLIGASAIFVFSFLVFSDKYFPQLPSGAYTGQISSLSDQEREFSTIYVEKIKSMDALLLVIFEQGWEPKLIRTEAVAEKDLRALKPVRFTFAEKEFALYGRTSGEEYVGTVLGPDDFSGQWKLRPTTVQQLRRTDALLEANFDFNAWLRLKAEARLLTQERNAQEQLFNSKQEQFKKLVAIVSENPDETQRRARLEVARLESAIDALKAEISELQGTLKSEVRDLEQLERITRRGRTVELARRVAKRENKWYQVNWEKGTDLTAIEESLADKMSIDLRKLRSNLSNAEETKALQNQIAEERARVRKLQKMYQRKLDEQRQRRPREGKPPWWKGWDSIFG